MGKRIAYFAFLGVIGLFKIMPLWLLYRISDFLYLIMAYVIQYRKSVIIKNLKKCFPEKSDKEINSIRKKFYKNLCDILLESIKGYTMSKNELLKRFQSFNCEVSDKYFDQGKDIIALTGHFANWEWGSAASSSNFKHQAAVLYKPISNPFIDKYIKMKRERFGLEMVSIDKTARYFLKKKPKPVTYYMVADQYPTNKEKQRVVNFFSSQTAFLHGPENYSKQFDLPVVYFEMLRLKRGHYSMEMHYLAENPKSLDDNQLTQLYVSAMENSIRKQPDNWMWSHKRWKKELYSFD